MPLRNLVVACCVASAWGFLCSQPAQAKAVLPNTLHRPASPGFRLSAWGDGFPRIGGSSGVSNSKPTSGGTSTKASAGGMLDRLLRRRDDFVSSVLEMEHHDQLNVAEELIIGIRRSTNGGLLPSAEGTVPKLDNEQKNLLHGVVPEVLRIMERLEKSGLQDARVFLYNTEALSYDLQLRSVIKAAGNIPKIVRNIDHMVEKHPKVHGGAPFIIKGCMSLNAPKPLRNVATARDCFETAHEIDPSNVRNKYFCAVAAYIQKDYQAAHNYFSSALDLYLQQAESGQHDDDGYLESQCKRGMRLARSHMGLADMP